jgi:replicative DNA helicase
MASNDSSSMSPSRVPPHDIEAEMAVLGAMLLEGEACQVALEIVGPEDFYRAQHRTICQAIVDIYASDQQPDELLLRERLEAKGLLEEVGGADYLHELAQSVPSTANVERYAEIVRDRSYNRMIISAHMAGLRDAESLSYTEAIEKTLGRFGEIVVKGEAGDGPQVVAEVTPSVIDAIETRQKDPRAVWGIATGLWAFDTITGGLHPGWLYIVAARSSVGKSALLTSWFNRIAETTPVLLFSLEMNRKDIVTRLLSMRTGLSFKELSSGLFRDDQWDNVLKSSHEIDKLLLHIDDSAGITLQQVVTRSKMMHARKGIKCIALDYLQLLSPPKAATREREVALISSVMKQLARTLDVPVILLSQFRKQDQNKKDNALPTKADLKDSGAIEQDADVIVFMHRLKNENGGYEPKTEFRIEKHRHGECGSEDVWFEGRRMQILDRNPRGA